MNESIEKSMKTDVILSFVLVLSLSLLLALYLFNLSDEMTKSARNIFKEIDDEIVARDRDFHISKTKD